MRGAGFLHNTYWVRAPANRPSRLMRQPGRVVGSIVHFSIANASTESRLPYFRGKGQLEEILIRRP